MLDEDAKPVTDAQVLDRVQAIGAMVIRRRPVESVDFTTWRRQLRREAKTRGLRIAVNQIGDDAIVVSNPDHVVTDEQRRAAVDGIAVPTDLQADARRGLRLVSDSAADNGDSR